MMDAIYQDTALEQGVLSLMGMRWEGDCARGQRKEPSFLVSLSTWKAAQAAEWECRAASFPHLATCKTGFCSLDSSDSWQGEVYEKMDIVG